MQLRANIGTLTHKMVEMSFKGQAITDEMKGQYGGESYAFYQQVWPTLKTKNILHSEVKIHSHQLAVAGTCDMIFKSHLDNHVIVYDLKTTKKAKYGIYLDGYKMQLACYAHCFFKTYQQPVERAVILMAYPKYSQEIELDRSEIREYLTRFAKIREEFRDKHGI